MLQLHRAKNWTDKLRAYRVMVDDKEIGDIRNGESKQFDVAPGQHSISLKLDWCRSPSRRFTAQADGDVVFDCASNVTGFKLLFATLFVIFQKNNYIRLQQRQP